MKYIISLFLLFLTANIIFTSCNNTQLKEPPEISEDILEEGDIILRRGIGLTSRVVLAADKDGTYSHTGIVIKDDSDNSWKIIHCVPGETDNYHPEEKIKKETFKEFFAPDRSISGAIFRLDTCPEIRIKAAEKAKEILLRELLFDHDYDLDDSTKMYCTELLYFVYKSTGVDITSGRRTSYPGFRNAFILPSDIVENKNMTRIFFYSNDKK